MATIPIKAMLFDRLVDALEIDGELFFRPEDIARAAGISVEEVERIYQDHKEEFGPGEVHTFGRPGNA